MHEEAMSHLLPPMASISSIKMMQGVFCLAVSNRSLTLFAPTPTYISSNSDYIMYKFFLGQNTIEVKKRVE